MSRRATVKRTLNEKGYPPEFARPIKIRSKSSEGAVSLEGEMERSILALVRHHGFDRLTPETLIYSAMRTLGDLLPGFQSSPAGRKIESSEEKLAHFRAAVDALRSREKGLTMDEALQRIQRHNPEWKGKSIKTLKNLYYRKHPHGARSSIDIAGVTLNLIRKLAPDAGREANMSSGGSDARESRRLR